MVFYMKDCLNKYIEDDELEKLLANKNSFEVPFLYYLKETIRLMKSSAIMMMYRFCGLMFKTRI